VLPGDPVQRRLRGGERLGALHEAHNLRARDTGSVVARGGRPPGDDVRGDEDRVVVPRVLEEEPLGVVHGHVELARDPLVRHRLALLGRRGREPGHERVRHRGGRMRGDAKRAGEWRGSARPRLR